MNEGEKEGVFEKHRVVYANVNLSLLFTYLSIFLFRDGPLGFPLEP